MFRFSFPALALVVCLAPSLFAQAKDWPQWRGPNRDGVGQEKGLLTDWTKTKPVLVWNSKEVNGGKSHIGEGWSTVSIAGDKIFTMGDVRLPKSKDAECFVFALDRETGKTLWETKIGGSRGNGGPRCTPTVDGDRVYALSNAGQLACLEAGTGKMIWAKDYVKDFKGKWMAGWFFCESPLVDGDKLVCTPGAEDAALVALNKMTGEVIWKAAIPKNGGAGYASIVISEVGGIRQYITFMGNAKGLVSVDANTGKLLWNYNRVANGTANISTPLIKGDLVFASTGYGTGAALLQMVPEGGTVKVVEKYFVPGKVLQNHHGQMIRLGDFVYGGHNHSRGEPFCFNMMEKKFAWGPETQTGNGSAAAAYADGHIYLRYEDNTLALIEATPEEYRPKGTFSIPGKGLGTGWPQPVILDGKLYIRARDQLLCFDLRAQK